MKKLLLLFATLLIDATAFTQSISPGGVNKVSAWYLTDPSRAVFKGMLPGNPTEIQLQNSSKQNSSLNHYPSLVFSGSSNLNIDLTSFDLSNASYFTVYEPDNVSSENIIWYTGKNQNTDLVLTTSRLADLGSYRYMNYTDIAPLFPKVHSYVQQKEKDSILVTSRFLSIGTQPATPQLPVTGFKGLVPEIVIYDRVLDWEEQVKVSSYLALKYGITLSEPDGLYLNSAGKQIWDGRSYSVYHHNIAGIIRDDSSGLLQRKASSSNNPELFLLSTNDQLPDNASLLWGDNDLPLVVGDKIPGIPLQLEKKWLTISNGLTGAVNVNIIIDGKQIDADLPVQPVYWLAVDRSGHGNFELSSTEYVRMTSIDRDNKIHFDEIKLNRSNGTGEILALIAAQNLLLTSSIQSPRCSDPYIGSLQVKVIGGKAPYELKLVKNGQLFQQVSLNNDVMTIAGLEAGHYRLIVKDAKQHSYTDEFYINNEDAPEAAFIASRYIVQEGQQVSIDAAAQMPPGLSYHWEGPGNFSSSDSKANLKTAGDYLLTISNGQCSFFKEIKVVHPPKGIFNKIIIYPNPSPGLFTVKISLDKPAAVSMNIYSSDGRWVSARQVKGFANYTFTEELYTNGMYYINFNSGLSHAAEKIIIMK